MASNYIPENNPNAPDSLTLQDMIKAYKSTTNEEFIIRIKNISTVVTPYWGNITGSIDNQKDLLALVSLRI